MSNECVLATLPGQNPDEQVVVVLVHDAEGSRFSLRQQTWSEGLGWYTQQSMNLEPQQVAQFKAVLGNSGMTPKVPQGRPAARVSPRDAHPSPFRLVMPESA